MPTLASGWRPSTVTSSFSPAGFHPTRVRGWRPRVKSLAASPNQRAPSRMRIGLPPMLSATPACVSSRSSPRLLTWPACTRLHKLRNASAAAPRPARTPPSAGIGLGAPPADRSQLPVISTIVVCPTLSGPAGSTMRNPTTVAGSGVSSRVP
jgi:hypothetical protein